MKKGFTLIELLAVIVVLAIIALIVTPVISKIIEGAKQRSSVTSAQNYIDSVNNIYALSMIDSNYEYLKDKTVLETGFDDNELSEIEISGKKPSYIKIEYDKSKNRVKEGKFCVDGTSVDYINGVATKSENDYCHKELVAGLYDKDNNLIISWDTLVNDYGMDLNWETNDATKYYRDDTGWYYRDKDYNKVYVQLSEVNSGNPSVVFEKNNLSDAAKFVISGDLGEIPDKSFLYFGYTGAVIFPKGITKIGVNSFAQAAISEVSIGPDVVEIGSSAFDETPNLKALIIPDNVIHFGSNDSSNFGGLYYSGVEKIKIGKGLSSLPVSFCHGCKKLKSIEIPSNIKEIPYYGFAFNESLSSVTLHEGLETIGEKAFGFTNVLKTIVLPNSLTRMGTDTFYNSGLESVTFGTGLTEIPTNAFRVTKIKSVILPDNIKKVGISAFEGCPIETLDLGSVEEIGRYAFEHDYESNAALKNIVIPSTVKKLGEGFIQLSNVLESVTFESPNYWTKSTFGKLSSGDYGYTETCEQVDVSTTEKIKNIMSANNGLTPYLTRWDSLSECQ